MIDGWITQLRKGLLEYCVLLALRRGESYGYELVQALQRSAALAVSESPVYPLLAGQSVVSCQCVQIPFLAERSFRLCLEHPFLPKICHHSFAVVFVKPDHVLH